MNGAPCRDPDATHVGVVMVHGVGFQRPGDTLLHWSRALERCLNGWASSRQLPEMPTVAARVGLQPEDARVVELQLPEQPDDAGEDGRRGALHIVISEALWAPYLQEPSIHDMSVWLGEHGAAGRLAEMVLGLRAGGETAPDQRNVYIDEVAEPDHAPTLSAAETAVAGMDQARRDPMGAARAAGRDLLLGFNRLRVGVVASGFASILLLLWGALRGTTRVIPFVGSGLAHVDRLLTGLAGDMHTLLDDAPQAANVRRRVGETVASLRDAGCSRVVLVAHSAGAVASYMTLGDPAFEDLPMDGLISFGQGLNAAWALTDADTAAGCEGARRAHARLIDDPRRLRQFTWVDYWASDDPVPAGSIRFPPCSPGQVDADHGRLWNRAASGSDHSRYWDNDEEFVMPVLADIVAIGDPSSGRGRLRWQHHDQLVVERRKRVSLLALWRRLAFIALPVAVVIAFTRPQYGGLDDLGAAITRAWDAIPFHELVSAPVATYQTWVAEVVLTSPIGTAVVLIGGVIFVAVASLIGSSVVIPFGRWTAWESRPRLRQGLRWLDIGAGLSLFAVSAVAVGPVFIFPLILVVLGSIATLLAQRIWEQMAGKRGAQQWGLTLVYLTAIGSFIVSVGSVLGVPIAGRLLLGMGVLYLFLLAVRGVGSWVWDGWDREARRRAIRDEILQGEGWFITGTGTALVAALLAIVVAVGFAQETALGESLPVAAATVAGGLVLTVVLAAAARSAQRTI